MSPQSLISLLGLLVCASMSIVVVASGVRSGRRPWLALVFLEAGLYFLGETLTALAGGSALTLALNFGSALYSLPALWLFARDAADSPVRKPLRHFLPALAVVPTGTALALRIHAEHGRGGLAAALFMVAVPIVQAVQLIAYGRAGLAASDQAERGGGSPWTRRALAASLAGFSAFYLISVVSLVLSIAADLSGGTSAAARGLSLPAAVTAALLAWTLALAFLWSSDATDVRRSELGEKYGGRPLAAAEAEAVLAGLRAALGDPAADLGGAQADPRRLAARLGVPYYVLSRVVNERAGKTLGDLINGYRIDRASGLLVSRPALTILEVALESGFGSKSTFNDVFKKRTGLTPSEFRRRALGGDSR